MQIFRMLLLGALLLLAAAVSAQPVSFELRNNSLQSIPLVITGVMNPNLSPMSNSGVTTETGTTIFFFHKRKRYLLLEVSPALEGKRIVVDELIRDRKRELGLN
ncbi:MAG: hypothetical protein NW241_16875 [Bacteroidia bacterium]|nr:hypothetical protein [Bacteroidia bacterium]